MISGKDKNNGERVVIGCRDAFAKSCDGDLGDAARGIFGHHVVGEAEFNFGDAFDIEHLQGRDDRAGAEGGGNAEGRFGGFDAAAAGGVSVVEAFERARSGVDAAMLTV